MSASSSAASSTLTRSKAAVLVLTSLAAACLIYYSQTRSYAELEDATPTTLGPGLHRSNAVHRRRRRTHTNEEQEDGERLEATETTAEGDENRETTVRPLGDGETVIDDHEWDWGSEPPNLRNGQNIVQLLFRVSEDATRRNAYVHRGCQCNSCGTVPIRGIRYRCSNCADFDLCEACEAQGLHTKTHIFYKVRIPTSSFATRQMQPVWYPGDPDTCMKSLPRDLVTRLSRETGFDRPELDAYWEQWTFMANTEWREDPDDLCLAMDRKTFDQCLVPSGGNRHAAPNLIHDRMFAFYDSNKDDLISFPEFLNGLAYRKKKDKLRKVFEGFDINGDGYVDRKDFLRMFRSYYVLYKQIHRDILEGLDDQNMNSTEAHQLIASRQPLSSAFGRDGRFPQAPDPRTGEGKITIDDDLQIVDNKGVVSESGNDLGNKEDVITESVVRDFPARQRSWDPTSSNFYWRAITDPPDTIASLQHDVLELLIRERRQTLQAGSIFFNNQLTGPDVPFHPEQDDNVYHTWPPNFVMPNDVQAIMGEPCPMDQVPSEKREEIIQHAKRRVRTISMNHQNMAAKDEIHERWKRRQFYTDEEEGAVAPSDWKEEEDIMHINGNTIETSKEVSPPSRPISPRSRSSSKVRFVEDTDDYEIRSNPSTSSRSIPERWGGMEIPEAEKDAGKEILYQVTQQACNELLDQLFKEEEDRAVAVVSSRKARDEYRHLFTHPSFEQWAVGLDQNPRKSKKRRVKEQSVSQKDARKEVVIPEVELDEVRQRPLDQLLAAAGFTVDPEARTLTDEVHEGGAAPSTIADIPIRDVIERTCDAVNGISLATGNDMISQTDGNSDVLSGAVRHSADHFDLDSSEAAVIETSDINAAEAVGLDNSSQAQDVITEAAELYRDPTLPQFRPNSIADIPAPAGARAELAHPPALPTTEHVTLGVGASSASRLGQYTGSQSGPTNPLHVVSLNLPESVAARAETSEAAAIIKENSLINGDGEKWQFEVAKARALESMSEDLRRAFEGVDWMVLHALREMEAAEKQAQAKGGWGRLNYEEFEAIIKGDHQSPMDEKKRVMMDYLGSWIEFCIP